MDKVQRRKTTAVNHTQSSAHYRVASLARCADNEWCQLAYWSYEISTSSLSQCDASSLLTLWNISFLVDIVRCQLVPWDYEISTSSLTRWDNKLPVDPFRRQLGWNVSARCPETGLFCLLKCNASAKTYRSSSSHRSPLSCRQCGDGSCTERSGSC